MEERFGRDLRDVRVHTDADAARSASAIGAQAYTVGQDVVFGKGKYVPHTPEGRTLLAHEVAHTVQQRGGGTPPSADPAGAHETSARISAQRIAAGQHAENAQPSAGVGLSMSPDDGKDVEEEQRKGKPAPRIGEIPTTSSLIPSDPRWDVDELIKHPPSDPEWDAYVAQRDADERNRRIEQEVNDELRTERFVALRTLLQRKHPHRDELAPFLTEHYSMRDLQILRRYGFEWGTRRAGSTKFRQTLVSAIEGYLAEQQNQQTGGAPSVREWTQEDEDARVKQLQQEAFFRAWLRGLPHVTGSVLGGGSAWLASQFTDDPEKITAAAEFGSTLSGVLGSFTQAKAQQGSYVPEAEVPFSAPGGARYTGKQPTKPADTKPAVKASPEVTPPPEQAAPPPEQAAPPPEQAAPPPPSAAKKPAPRRPKGAAKSKPPKAARTPRTKAAGSTTSAPKTAAKPPKARASKAEREAKYAQDLDTRIETARKELNEARRRTVEYKNHRAEQNLKQKGGPSKGMWNKEEELYVLERARAHPDRTVLEQVRLVGVRKRDGTIIDATAIAEEGRTVDFLEIGNTGTKVLGGEVKSKAEIVHSVEDLRGPGLVGGFKGTSKVGQQRSKESQIIDEARKSGGTLIFKGKDVRTGVDHTVEVDTAHYESTDVAYDQIVPN
jgi:hypothetical protein